jgi:hypothetical protein
MPPERADPATVYQWVTAAGNLDLREAEHTFFRPHHPPGGNPAVSDRRNQGWVASVQVRLASPTIAPSLPPGWAGGSEKDNHTHSTHCEAALWLSLTSLSPRIWFLCFGRPTRCCCALSSLLFCVCSLLVVVAHTPRTPLLSSSHSSIRHLAAAVCGSVTPLCFVPGDVILFLCPL